ncbi:hypothetical protein DES34_109109 [Brevibacillus brevis]|nr:hypothetical protein DES34_109109 [Brevibacillus brevis]GEC88654.1 hypothetical protein BBR01nite_09850 [Brevibacillus brevis]VEF86854.1 Uncharacterised protein [Brevibacillus brevis]
MSGNHGVPEPEPTPYLQEKDNSFSWGQYFELYVFEQNVYLEYSIRMNKFGVGKQPTE